MKKNKLTLIVVIALSAIAGYFLYSNQSGTIRKELRDFAVKDTASITKIFMADAFGNTITIERQDVEKWMVNNKFEARRDAIDLVLKTVSRMEVKAPVSKAAFETVVKNLAGNSTKVEIYTGKNKPSKTYFVGGATPDNFGTYMLLEGSSVPFIMHIPGFYGYLTSRFFTDEVEWKSTVLYNYNPATIEKIELNYLEVPHESFVLENISSGKPVLKSALLNKTYNNIDTLAIYYYINAFRKVNVEFYATDVPEEKRDSIMTHCKKFTITITDKEGNVNNFIGFNKPVKEGAEDLEGNPIVFDMDRMYGLTNDNEFVIIQYFVFDELTPRISFFLRDEVVKK
jgi:hypothetical protein